jgi:hypothetical protein
MLPKPLKTILSPERYPFAVALMEDGEIKYTVAYEQTLEDIHKQMKIWNKGYSFDKGQFIMAEQQNGYWVAV